MSDRWRRIEEIFHSALERAPEERAAFLDRACAGDPSLRRDVEILIKSDAQVMDGSFLDPPYRIEKLSIGLSDEKITLPMTNPAIAHSAEAKTLDRFSDGGSDKTGFPVADWDRYEFVKFLGKGGMGAVYLARDPRLARLVALKFIRGNDPEQIERLAREARAQARIDHENVCGVYEVGEVEGKPYIAMQYIEGESIEAACAKMPLEQKARLIKEAAEGLHCAHRMGIVHRDVKPANIMVERDEDGSPHVRVMDFGLARDLDADRKLTVAGMIIGTPSYMSPEQANGEVDRLDRRTDVYSLGATLYELLAGKPPFYGRSHYETLTMVVNDDPTLLRKLSPTVPKDLETITMKCLEKDPLRRYESARALAEDLQRYLDGEPILSRRSSSFHRIVRLAQKNRAATAVIAVAFLVVSILSAGAIQTRMEANEQARLAEQFAREAEKIETIMERAYILPLHDVGRERALVESSMEKIRNRMTEAGAVGKSVGHYALGRGFLALHDYPQALEHLELALKEGYASEEIAYPLGFVLGQLYAQKLNEIERTENRDLWQARAAELEKAYGERAHRYLTEYVSSARAGSRGEAAYVECRIAFYEKKFDAAIEKARIAFEEAPWLYKAKQFEGEAHGYHGRRAWERGNIEEAEAAFAGSEEAYARALEIAHSDASVYLAAAQTHLDRMEMGLERGRPFDDQFGKAIAACDNALMADGKSAEAYVKKSYAYLAVGEYEISRGINSAAFEKTIETARLAVEIDPRNIGAINSMGLAHYMTAQYKIERKLDPTASLDSAIECLKRAVEINPGMPGILSNLGNAYWRKGMYEMGLGADPSASLDKAMESHKKAIKISPDYALPYSNLGNAYEIKGEYEAGRGIDPSASLAGAVENYRKAVELNPNFVNAYVNIGLAYKTKGSYEMQRGNDPRASLSESLKGFQRGIELNPNFPFALVKMADAYLKIAEFEIEHGGLKSDALKSARKALDDAARINPNYFEIPLMRGQLKSLEASR